MMVVGMRDSSSHARPTAAMMNTMTGTSRRRRRRSAERGLFDAMMREIQLPVFSRLVQSLELAGLR
jgi:hypothetical protein